jgi:hypothetical protein
MVVIATKRLLPITRCSNPRKYGHLFPSVGLAMGFAYYPRFNGSHVFQQSSSSVLIDRLG